MKLTDRGSSCGPSEVFLLQNVWSSVSTGTSDLCDTTQIVRLLKVFFNITKLNFINLTESTFHGALSYDVVKQLCIVGIHPPTAGTCHHLFLSVAAQVLSQLRTAFSSRFTV